MIAYDVLSGKDVWSAKVIQGGEVAPSAAYHNGVVYFGTEQADLVAIKSDGSGDVSKSHLLWSTSESYLPDVVSPLVTDEFVILAKDRQLTLVDAKKGETALEKEWKEPKFQPSPNWFGVASFIPKLETKDVKFHASPILVGDTVYLLDQAGVMHMFKPSKTFAETTAAIGEGCSATPAFASNRIFIRGYKNVYCVGK